MASPTSEKGTYLVVLELARDTCYSAIGRRGQFRDITLPAGCYTYIGSAHGSGGVAARIRHHLRTQHQRPHWHLDFVRPAMTVKEVWFTADPVRRECTWASLVQTGMPCTVPVPGFGSADCSNGCAAHFFLFQQRPSFAAFRKATEAIRSHAIIERCGSAALASVTAMVPVGRARRKGCVPVGGAGRSARRRGRAD
jgi:Uri superfamily endonuclease